MKGIGSVSHMKKSASSNKILNMKCAVRNAEILNKQNVDEGCNGTRFTHDRHRHTLSTLLLTLRLLMPCIYGAPILDVSRSHMTTHHSR